MIVAGAREITVRHDLSCTHSGLRRPCAKLDSKARLNITPAGLFFLTVRTRRQIKPNCPPCFGNHEYAIARCYTTGTKRDTWEEVIFIH